MPFALAAHFFREFFHMIRDSPAVLDDGRSVHPDRLIRQADVALRSPDVGLTTRLGHRQYSTHLSPRAK
jgi:hypothetical protein